MSNSIKLNKAFMISAIEEAKKAKKSGNYAIGSVIVKDDRIIARSPNITRSANDPTKHAELEVIRKALAVTGERFLEGATLYTTHEPCPMCATACVWVKMSVVVFGARISDMADFARKNSNQKWKWRTVNIGAEEVFQKGYPKVNSFGGYMREECKSLFHS